MDSHLKVIDSDPPGTCATSSLIPGLLFYYGASKYVAVSHSQAHISHLCPLSSAFARQGPGVVHWTCPSGLSRTYPIDPYCGAGHTNLCLIQKPSVLLPISGAPCIMSTVTELCFVRAPQNCILFRAQWASLLSASPNPDWVPASRLPRCLWLDPTYLSYCQTVIL